MAKRRIIKELKDFNANPVPNFTVSPMENDLFHWTATMKGHHNTPYEGGQFVLDIVFPQDYPFKPMKVKFLTKIFHPNIHPQSGDICCECAVQVFADNWSPALTISKILLIISSVITDPNTECGRHLEARKLYKTNRAQFDKVATEWTNKYATNKPKASVSEIEKLKARVASLENENKMLKQKVMDQQNDFVELEKKHELLQQKLMRHKENDGGTSQHYVIKKGKRIYISAIVIYKGMKKRVVLKNDPKRNLYEYTMQSLKDKILRKLSVKGLVEPFDLRMDTNDQCIVCDEDIVKYLVDYMGNIEVIGGGDNDEQQHISSMVETSNRMKTSNRRVISLIVVFNGGKKRLVLKDNSRKNIHEYKMDILKDKIRQKFASQRYRLNENNSFILKTNKNETIQSDEDIVKYLSDYTDELHVVLQ